MLECIYPQLLSLVLWLIQVLQNWRLRVFLFSKYFLNPNIYYRARKQALELARSRGIMIITLTEVFGTKVVEALKTVRNIDITNLKPDKVRQVLGKLSDSGQDGKFGSLKGILFNFLISTVFSDYGFRPIIGKEYRHPEKKEQECECDIVITDNENIIICEVKGRQKSNKIALGKSENEKDSVKRFFERT